MGKKEQNLVVDGSIARTRSGVRNGVQGALEAELQNDETGKLSGKGRRG
jgi:hypothetical protein